MEQTVTIWAPGGSTVNLRKHQDRGSALVDRIPIGETVILEYLGDEWSRVRYKGKTGYVMTEFLKFGDEISTTGNVSAGGNGTSTDGTDAEQPGMLPSEDDESDTITIHLRREQAEALLPVLSDLMNQMKEKEVRT